MRPNPHAFPSEGAAGGAFRGMTLRDYFAAQALAGLQARYSYSPTFCAVEAYKLADAMLEAR